MALDIELVERCVGHLEASVKVPDTYYRDTERLKLVYDRAERFLSKLEDIILCSEEDEIERFKQEGLL